MTFFAAAWAVTLAPRTSAGPRPAERWSIRALADMVTAGLPYGRAKPDLRSILVLIGAATLAYSGLFAVALPAFAHALSRGALALGILLASWGAGQLAGAVSASVTGLPSRWGLLVVGMAVCEGLSFLVIGWTSSPTVACALPRVLLPPVSMAVMGALAVISVRLPFLFAAAPMLLAAVALTAAGASRQLAASVPADEQPGTEGHA